MLVKVRNHRNKRTWIETTYITIVVDLEQSQGDFNVYTADGSYCRISSAQAERLLTLMRQHSNEHDLTQEEDNDA